MTKTIEAISMKRKFLLLSALTLIVITAGASASAPQRSHRAGSTAKAPAEAPGIKNIFWQPNELQQGSPALFTVELDRAPSRVSATWIGKTLSFFKTGNPKIWYALAGNDVETQPGSYDLAVMATMPGGRVARSIKKIDVASGNFLTGSVDVPENFVEPDAAGKKQIAVDVAAKTRAYAHLSPAPLWTGNFRSPVAGKSTPSFGESRILNEEKESLHRGTDFPVNEGSLVEASNAGTVVLAKDLFYEGGCVIIDHGQKLFTIYMHLSKIDVNAGDNVAKGAHLGLSGKSGRVTGPHLHMGVRWNGAYLDPVKLLGLTLPAIPANERGVKTAPRASRPTRRR